MSEEPKQPDGENPEEESKDGKAVKDRWWVDFGDKQREKKPPKPEAGPVGSRFYQAGKGFDQDVARARLTDLNMKLLVEANPPEGGWGYVLLAEKRFSERECERIKGALKLPSYARGAVIDSGRTIRLLVTGTPIGERILELTLGDEPSFDCWIQGEWVREALYKDRRRALTEFRKRVDEFLSPDGIAHWEAGRAQA
jgi:hypothetical protein